MIQPCELHPTTEPYRHPDGRLICRECRREKDAERRARARKLDSNKHLLIGDLQIREGVPRQHLRWIARYCADKRVNKIIQIGDWGDMPSLSSYDTSARKAVDRRTVKKDFDVTNTSIEEFEEELDRAGYQPDEKHVTLGNHEQRIERYTHQYPEHEGDINYDRFVWKKYGWAVHDFLDPVTIDGVVYAHYFPRGPQGHITQTKRGAPNAMVQVKREMQSCSSGHLPGLDMAILPTGARAYRGLILGSSYLHDEKFLTGQGNRYWRGVVLKHNVDDGWYDACEVPLSYLERKYG